MDYVIYIDGSFNTKTNLGGYGLVITKDNKVLYEESETLDGEGLSMRNVFGEIVGACRAIELCNMYGIRSVTIAFDYEGIEKWANGEWKRKNEYTQKYYSFMQSVLGVMDIKFLKIKSHSGDKFNDMADKLAKKGAGF